METDVRCPLCGKTTMIVISQVSPIQPVLCAECARLNRLSRSLAYEKKNWDAIKAQRAGRLEAMSPEAREQERTRRINYMREWRAKKREAMSDEEREAERLKTNALARESYYRRKEANQPITKFCVTCGKPIPSKAHKYCAKCAEKAKKEYQRDYRRNRKKPTA